MQNRFKAYPAQLKTIGDYIIFHEAQLKAEAAYVYDTVKKIFFFAI
jgi:hypothetical protein